MPTAAWTRLFNGAATSALFAVLLTIINIVSSTDTHTHTYTQSKTHTHTHTPWEPGEAVRLRYMCVCMCVCVRVCVSAGLVQHVAMLCAQVRSPPPAHTVQVIPHCVMLVHHVARGKHHNPVTWPKLSMLLLRMFWVLICASHNQHFLGHVCACGTAQHGEFARSRLCVCVSLCFCASVCVCVCVSLQFHSYQPLMSTLVNESPVSFNNELLTTTVVFGLLDTALYLAFGLVLVPWVDRPDLLQVCGCE